MAKKNRKRATAERTLWQFVDDYCANVREGLDDRWASITPDIYARHAHEAIGGLLARQATLAIEFARAVSTWNVNTAPLFLRCMVDAYITLAWILGDPAERGKKYVYYGLGQEKLFIEYLEEAVREDAGDYDAEHMRQMIEVRKSWLNEQLAEWATEVNVGAWAGIGTREMAQQIGRESIYKFAYVPFSGAAHNMWQHVGMVNVEPCTNPLHKGHRVPRIRDFKPEPDFLYRSAKYVSLSYQVFDEKCNVSSGVKLPVDFFLDHAFFAASSDGDAARSTSR
jgi:hypothetical protein